MKNNNIAEIAKSLVGKYKLDQPNFEFDREGLLESMNAYFIENIEELAGIRRAKDKYPYIYPDFKQSVSRARVLWDTLNITKGKTTNRNLGEPLWGCFYAKYVIPFRNTHFKEATMVTTQFTNPLFNKNHE